jgi:hypothetical protein
MKLNLSAIFKMVNGKKIRVLPPKVFLAVVLRHLNEYAFLATNELRNASPILLNFDGFHEHALIQINHILGKRDIVPESIDLPPIGVSLRPFVDMNINLAMVTLSAEEMARVRVAGFTTMSQAEVSLHSENNLIFDLLERFQAA